MRRFIAFVIGVLLCVAVGATHNRAGQILYKHISGYNYEFTVTTFTYRFSLADRETLDISWGDNSSSTMYRSEELVEYIDTDYKKNVYKIRHTFPGPGVYTIIVEDPNRNLGVLNIPNSVSVVFSVKTVFKIDPSTGANSAPELLTYPIDKAALNRRFVHNPSAYDVDGDSLAYELRVCTREEGVEIENYSYPEYSKEFYVDQLTGDLVWDAPTKVGLYNIAMAIKEYRKGVQIGSIIRDMQVEVVDSKNTPPTIIDPKDTCVLAGATIEEEVEARDAESDNIHLSATGGPFQVRNKAVFEEVERYAGYYKGKFKWKTDYQHVRKQPYTVTFKAEDQNPEVKLVSFANYDITVISPAVENVRITPYRNSIRLDWNVALCEHAAGYDIYRRIASDKVLEDEACLTGIPEGYGYERIARLNSRNYISYEDDNNGLGLSPGIEYCYRIVVWFADGAESKASEEVCGILAPGIPPMIKASVETVATNGTVELKWIREYWKKELETNGPYEYRLYVSKEKDLADKQLLYKTPTPNNEMKDTIFVHNNVNTLDSYPYYYTVELWDVGTNERIDNAEVASTLYPVLEPTDEAVIVRFGRYTPWVNTEYTIYRCMVEVGASTCNPTEEIATTQKESYIDTGLENGKEYVYRIKSEGYRKLEDVVYKTTNLSHIASAIPQDNVAPCAVELEGKSLCSEGYNLLTWMYPSGGSCDDDVQKYSLYFAEGGDNNFQLLTEVQANEPMEYKHSAQLRGCYYIKAEDKAGNVSDASNIVCLDECGTYSLPNVFSPNGDNVNDLYRSYNPGGVKHVEMKIYNRWGKLVFQTSDPDINWDGRDMTSKGFVPSGVYYYMCDVYEERLTGSRIIPLAGFLHLYYETGAKPFERVE